MKEIIQSEQLIKTIKRMTHEIIENNTNLDNVILVGILNKGYPLALMLKNNLKSFADVDVALYQLDISSYRDDEKFQEKPTSFIDTDNKNIIIVDDVLFTGRTIKAALNALSKFKRASTYQLAVLIDRGHRELPIRADYVGKNIPTAKDDLVVVDYQSMKVYLTKKDN